MLSIKCIFAYYQMCFCLLSNVNMIAVKCNQKSYLIIKNANATYIAFASLIVYSVISPLP